MSLLPKHAFGLDISDFSIEALAIKKKFGKLSIVSYSRKRIPSGVVENGSIINKEKLVESIKEVISSAKPQGFKSKDVILSIPESKSYIHIFKFPSVITEKNLSDSVQYEAEETIPLSFDQVYHDFEIIQKKEDYQDVLYVACLREIVDDYRQVVQKAGLNPIVFEAETMAMARALVHDNSTSVLIVDIGARTTIITIFDRHGIRYSKNFKIAGNDFTEKIMSSAGVNEEKADRLKKEVGLLKNKQLNLNLEALVQQIIEAIKQAISNYQASTGFDISKVVLSGGTSQMPGLVELFSNQLKIKTEIGNPLSGLKMDSKAVKPQSPVLFSTVIGLAKRGLNNQTIKAGINLIDKKDNKKHVKIKDEAEKPEKNKAGSGLKFNLGFKKINRRTLTLLTIFIILALLFVALIIFSGGSEEPLIKFQSYDYPAGPVEYEN